ncbi:DsbE family thiol:disulfide interchange protein [Altericroceibacterium spongiae]|uniref:DsbE family thiol:disulfide interchange protein n=1 Tax=Altericroceibacterium spongiae TaxID=2320269 RepID=A0A420EMP6_9SPHN|nr:DsbE family thiol:disulfide interchange protein [Altericroceibacterium spongiae]RKF21989.1 DsbE family thiol:disulfide interchange protein [Altericroceibacterium spongiae]
MRNLRIGLWALVAVVIGLFALFAIQLSRPKDDSVESRMIGKPVPEFALKPIVAGRPGLTSADLKDGQPKLLNIFASWCVPCAAEAPQLAELEAHGADIVGVAIRDRPEDVARFLDFYGDPYSRIGGDDLSEVQIDIGSSGVPETFIVDGKGTIRYQHIGDIREDDVPLLLQKLNEAAK